ncbi:MAG TPA: inactive transglutaminase family protein [Pseudomonadales bacterium]
MSARMQVMIWAALLVTLGIGLSIYKSVTLGFPLFPGEYRTVWTVEARVSFKARGQPVRVSLALPREQAHMHILEESFSGTGYGFQQEIVRGQDRAVWSRREARGPQSLFYKLSIYNADESDSNTVTMPAPKIRKPDFGSIQQESVRLAAESITARAHQLSSDPQTFSYQLLMLINDVDNPDAAILRADYEGRGNVALLVDLLALADIPAHAVRGIFLEHNRRQLQPQELLELYINDQWIMMDPVTGKEGTPDNFFIWQRGGFSLVDVTGGSQSEVSFSVIANDISARTVALQQGKVETVALLDFSIYSLPIEQQSVFKLILLVPIGALMVILFRVFIGIRTSGTFMPVLLALAFLQTQLLTGLIIFLLVLAVGLGVRSYLSRLNLLLVARIAAVVVVVVIIMATISVISYKLHIEQALTVVFFPMIILAWTIERMSILWEEDGAKEAVIQIAGSLLVASAAYFMMTNPYIEHWSFNFPELMFAVLGIILLLGQYSGYRLSELIRFRDVQDTMK